MRKRGAQAATTQTGRMGAEDPSGISGHTLLMPIYEYRCEVCGKRSSALLTSFSSPDPVCPHCGKAGLHRLVSTFATVHSGDDGGEGDSGDFGGDGDSGGGDFGDGDDGGGGFDGDDDF
ncbi:MAG TPA: zinc ribbon domain-containing protein [Candidatus Dormibacteraeota bacterium]|nr:zinc ribbon domain-containing protein [Candidatus Dormibacteraeota bacterium]